MRNFAIFAVPLLLFASAAGAQTGHRVKVNGMTMYYEVSGSGSPLVMLHGAYMNIRDMGTIIPKRARTHRVYALKFQGHGHARPCVGTAPQYRRLAGRPSSVRPTSGVAGGES